MLLGHRLIRANPSSRHFFIPQPIPPGVTYSKALSKLKARMSLFTETWQKRRSSFELWPLKQLSKLSPQVGSAVPPPGLASSSRLDQNLERGEFFQHTMCDLTMARARGWWDERSADPIDSPARPHRPLLTMHATRAQDQTRERRVSPSSLLTKQTYQTGPQPKPLL